MVQVEVIETSSQGWKPHILLLEDTCMVKEMVEIESTSIRFADGCPFQLASSHFFRDKKCIFFYLNIIHISFHDHTIIHIYIMSYHNPIH